MDTPSHAGRLPAIEARAPTWAVALLGGVLLWSLVTDLYSLLAESRWSPELLVLVMKVIIDHGALALVGRYPYVAAIAVWVALPISLGTGHVGMTLLSLPGVTVGVLALCRHRFATAHALVAGGWVAVQIILGGDSLVGWTLVLFLVPSVLAGLLVRFILVRSAGERERVREAAEAASRVHEQERLELSRELHDVVASGLALISMETSSVEDSHDSAELRQALHTVQRTSRAASAELRSLVGSLRQPSGPEPARNLAEHSNYGRGKVVDASLQETQALADRGFAATLDLTQLGGMEIEDLLPSTWHTYLRILQECTTNIIKHAPPGAKCLVVGDIQGCSLRIRVVNELANEMSSLVPSAEGGVGLRGIGERVALTSGSVRYGPIGTEWVVEAILPFASTDGRWKPDSYVSSSEESEGLTKPSS